VLAGSARITFREIMGATARTGLVGAVFGRLTWLSRPDAAVAAARAKKVGKLWEMAPLTFDHYIL
jgi:hypothetical protein